MDILKVYKSRCREEFKQYGFKSYGNNHYRIINDVYQDFLLFRSMSGFDCRIHFTVIPLCEGIDERYKCGGYWAFESGELGGEWGWTFKTGEHKESRGWMFEYNRNSEESIRNCVEEMISYIKTKIIPFLEIGCDSTSAYREIKLLKNSYAGSREQREYDLMDDYRMYCMLLKIGNYDKAIEYFRQRIKGYQDSIEDKFADHISSDEEKEELKIKIAETEEQIRLISDHDYVNNFIETNEQKSLENLLTPKELEKWKKANGKD